MANWEYKVVPFKQSDVSAIAQWLNAESAEGFELVAVEGGNYYFKREKEEVKNRDRSTEYVREGHYTEHPLGKR